MLKSLLARIPFLRQRPSGLSEHDDQLKADAAARKKGWNDVIAEHQKPLGPQSARPSGKDS